MSRGKSRWPDFLGVGPPRTGTTWLHRTLVGRVGLPLNVKEINFFDVYYDKGADWYLSHFRRADPQLPMGEVCNYFAFPKARERIQKHMPGCRIIVSLRDPVERAYSHYKLMRCRAYTKAGFEEFLATRPQVTGANRYAFHLADWFARFGRQRVLVCFYDDLKKDPQAYSDRISDFIGIARSPLDSAEGLSDSVNSFSSLPRSHKLAQNARHLRVYLKRNRAYRTINLLATARVWEFCFGGGPLYPRLTPEEDARVRERFRPEVEALEDLLKLDLTAWKSPARSLEQSPAAEPLAAG